MNKYIKIIILLIITTIIAIVAAYLLRPQGEIKFSIAPKEVTMKSSDSERTVTREQVIKLKPGMYTFSFSREGFSSTQSTIEVKDNETTEAFVALEPVTAEARMIIDNDPESAEIIEKYRALKQEELLSRLPITSAGFSLERCTYIGTSDTDQKAVCLNTSNQNSRQVADEYLDRLGFSLAGLKVYSGENNLMTLARTDTYRIEFYSGDHSKLFITPMNVPYIPPTVENNDQLESIKSAALIALDNMGATEENYTITYSNSYLARYNEDIYHAHSPDDEHDE